jgi:hypothetical protein
MKTCFSGFGKRKNNSASKRQKLGNFSKWGVEPFLNLIGSNFRPKKLGTKFSWEERESKKMLTVFSK